MPTQDLDPLRLGLTDYSARTSQMQWIETTPGKVRVKILWTDPSTGGWAVLTRWAQGYQGPAHKHMSSAHSFIVSGALQVDGVVYRAGDYVYEPDGIVHHVTRAEEDTEFFFLSNGPVLFFKDDAFTHYVGWEEARHLAENGPGDTAWV